MAERDLRDAVVVITGASSGIGRATAQTFAEQGATVVAAARREDPLEDLVESCQATGATALAVPTDVSDQDEVNQLARRAVEAFGRIDIWVNNAGVAAYGKFEDIPPDVFRQVIDTNFFGVVNGCRSALPYMRQHGNGVIINVSSVVGAMGGPYNSAYAASKFAIRGFSDCLRQDLRETPIEVSTILPAAIDTPFFEHAANYAGRVVKPIDPVYEAQKVADAIVACAIDPQREVFVGSAGKLASISRRIMPGLHERIFARQVEMNHFEDTPAPATPGNVFEPVPHGTGVSGNWKTTTNSTGKKLGAAGLVAGGAAAAGWYTLRRDRNA